MAICTIFRATTHLHNYAPHDIMDDLSGIMRSERAALTNTDRTSVGRIIAATVIIYVAWVTIQVIRRALERYLG